MKKKSIPKYIEIENYFISKIENNELNFGDKIPTEMELCDIFDVSRMTINKALTRLSNKGYITRNRGVGSFVTNKSLKKDISNRVESMTQDIINAGMKPSIKLLDYRVIRGKMKSDISKKLKLSDDDYIHYFSRLRYGDGKPLALSYSYISFKILPEINVSCLEGSFNEYIDTKGIKRTRLYDEFSAILPTEEQKLLGCYNVALLKRNLLWYVDDVPFEYTVHFLLGNFFKFTHTLDLIISDEEADTY